MPGGPASELLSEIALLDAHAHLLLSRPVDGARFERCCTEADRRADGTSAWDTPAGLAIRRWCPPALDLPPFAAPADYLARRAELGVPDVTQRLLRAARLSHVLVETGLTGPDLMDAATLGQAAGATVSEVVRLETVATDLAAAGVSPDSFATEFAERLAAAARTAVALKSIVAYRSGLDVDPARPPESDVRRAAGEWLSDPAHTRRLAHPVLLRFLLWTAVDTGLPLQIHAGLGDADLPLIRSDPARLQPWLEAVEPAGVPVVLLHCYPYHRQAGWLASVYPHVYADVGLSVGQLGTRARAFLAECLELAPWGKVLFSTDGYRLPELYLVGAAQFRHSLGVLLDTWVGEGALPADDAVRLAGMVAAGNAARLYRL